MTCFLPSQTPPDLATAAARLQTLVQMYDAAVKDAEHLEEVRCTRSTSSASVVTEAPRLCSSVVQDDPGPTGGRLQRGRH